MNTLELNLKNIKCDGCVKNIKAAMEQHDYVFNVEIEKATGHVKIIGENLVSSNIIEELTALGYPEVKKGLFSKIFTK